MNTTADYRSRLNRRGGQAEKRRVKYISKKKEETASAEMGLRAYGS